MWFPPSTGRNEHPADVSRSDTRGLSRAIVINKLDADNVDLPSLVESIQAAFGKNCVLFNVPDRVGPGIREIHRLLDPRQILPTVATDRCRFRVRSLIEAVVESDEALLEKYTSREGTVTLAELEADITRRNGRRHARADLLRIGEEG